MARKVFISQLILTNKKEILSKFKGISGTNKQICNKILKKINKMYLKMGQEELQLNAKTESKRDEQILFLLL